MKILVTFLFLNHLGSFTEAEIRSLGNDMYASVKNLSDLLNNLLNWAQAQMQHLRPVPEAVLFSEVAARNLSLVHEQAMAKRIDLTLATPPNLRVWADSNMLDTILRNLLSNAIKFTGSGG